MYTLAIRRDFIAQHYLIGGDWGEENVKHSHHYQTEIQLEGYELDQHGYLEDILAIESLFAELVNFYRDKTLNDLAEFREYYPSIERFAFILCGSLSEKISNPNISAITVKIWENEIAWASYRLERGEKE
ncbi:MAG: 6-carboxytetrahydropterin synthase [Methanotrichaceae archaeon]|nr:6-carboxytetrahydropterin synthase [Methanotrichaceae archaeon]